MSSNAVYTGFWRNHNTDGSAGSGLTLTVPQTWGAFLIAFVALFVSASMANLWSIICFFIHQYRSTPSSRPGLHHQQQALLSNPPTAAASAFVLLNLAWSWRGKIPGAGRLSMPLASAAVLYLALLSAAGLFSSRLILQGDQVLLANKKCGWPASDQSSLITPSDTARLKWVRSAVTQAQEYVRNCYKSQGIFQTDNCNIYATETLPISQNTTKPCPFASKICDQSDAMEIDTGYIDSNIHLGINTAKEDQLLSRTRIACAPILAEEKYSSAWTSHLPSWRTAATYVPGDKWKLYDLGPSVESNNFTWAISNYSMLDTDGFGRTYALGVRASYAGFQDNLNVSTFSAIDELVVPHADTTVLFLLNAAVYLNATKDPWFRASGHIDRTGLARQDSPYYYPDRMSSAVACTQQWQYCTSNSDDCTPFMGKYERDLLETWHSKLNPQQKGLFELLSRVLSMEIRAIASLGATILQASEEAFPYYGVQFSVGLPPTQWQNEMMHIIQVGLATTQRLLANFPSAPDFPMIGPDGMMSSHKYVVEPEEEVRFLCSLIRAKDARFSNFSVAGILVILGLGLLIIFINLVLLPGAAFWFRQRFGMRTSPQAEWLEGRLFMMQRSLLQTRGMGSWQVDGYSDIPWTLELSVDTSSEEVKVQDTDVTTKDGYRYVGVQRNP